jgi:hypothetical protein
MQDFPTALQEGELGLSNGCFTLNGLGGPWVLLWPPTYAPVVIDDVPGVIAGGGLVATLGQRIEAGGGEISDATFALELTGGNLPATCRTPKFWLASEVRVIET